MRLRDTFVLVLLCSRAAFAHFILDAPSNNFTQGILGDPQKAPPCGDEGSSTATDKVTTFVAGQTITITVNETIYHPGHTAWRWGSPVPRISPPNRS